MLSHAQPHGAAGELPMAQDWIVDGRQVGEIRDDGSAWLDDRADFEFVKDLPYPGEMVRRHLHLGALFGLASAASCVPVFRGPLREDQVAGERPKPS